MRKRHTMDMLLSLRTSFVLALGPKCGRVLTVRTRSSELDELVTERINKNFNLPHSWHLGKQNVKAHQNCGNLTAREFTGSVAAKDKDFVFNALVRISYKTKQCFDAEGREGIHLKRVKLQVQSVSIDDGCSGKIHVWPVTPAEISDGQAIVHFKIQAKNVKCAGDYSHKSRNPVSLTIP